MTQIFAGAILTLLVALSIFSLPPVKARLGVRASRWQGALFKSLLCALWAFSMNETINETGVLYGILFSLLPLPAGFVVASKLSA
ncbi:hypothetical protein ACI77O_12925 [Pseudomonas tritici]|uniref:hypothetical protein n=1 Tax=Pseudomonas tritici TaxID=2745518 RepID=UPI00387A9A30